MTHLEQESQTAPPQRPGRPVAALVLVALFGLAAVIGGQRLGRLAAEVFGRSGEETAVSLVPGTEVEVVIPAGASAQEIGRLLETRGLIRSAVEFELAVRTSGAQDRLQAGTYTFVAGGGLAEVIAQLEAGPAVLTFWVTIPEGLRVDEILVVLSEASGRPASEFERSLLAREVKTRLRSIPAEPTLADWEGLLFPDTYQFVADVSPSDVLARLVATMEERVEALDWSAFEEAGLSRYEGLVIASMIEAETRVDDDRPLVSSVIRNRLAEGMALQIDATILYAMGERGSGLTLDDLEIESPYNTYLNPGLPPTPIGAPGRASLEAAAAPAETDYLYYVLSGEDGSHTFTASYDEFLRLKEEAKAKGIIP